MATEGKSSDDSGGLAAADTGDTPAAHHAGRDAPLPVGTIVSTYRLLGVLGEGGMGRVYLAEHTKLGRKVALKMLHDNYARDRLSVERFFREARAVNQIRHENIVEVTDFIDDEARSCCYIMELLEGRTLAEELSAEGPLRIDRLRLIGIQVAGAMAAVHEAKMIHRDLKPQNIVLSPRLGRPDFVKLLDFGVAKLFEHDGQSAMLETQAGAQIGTPLYMAPEQLQAKSLDHRADIYAFGVVLFQCATGTLPFMGDSVGELVFEQLTSKPAKPRDRRPELPEDLEQLVLQCLEIDPAKRPDSMREVATRLLPEGAVDTTYSAVASASSDAIPIVPAAPAPASMGPRGLTAAAALLVVVCAAAAVLVMTRAPAPAIPPTPAAASTVPPLAREAPPDRVTLRFTSTPEGATVKRVEGTSLGVTPLEVKLASEDREVAFSITREGYRDVTATLSLRRDGEVTAVLQKLPAAEPGGARSPERSTRAAPSEPSAPAPAKKERPRQRRTRESEKAPEPAPDPKPKPRQLAPDDVIDVFGDG